MEGAWMEHGTACAEDTDHDWLASTRYRCPVSGFDMTSNGCQRSNFEALPTAECRGITNDGEVRLFDAERVLVQEPGATERSMSRQ